MSSHIELRLPRPTTTAACRRAPRFLLSSGALGLALAFSACDGGAAVTDASAPLASRAAQIALRVDVQATAPASLSALAYRAAYSGISRREVLGLVDPLAGGGASRVPGSASSSATRAEAETGCVIRDLDRASTDLAAHGDSIELEELKGIAVSALNSSRAELLRLSPRLFPDIAASVGGVVSEGGPIGLRELPAEVRVTEGGGSAAVGSSGADVALPAPAWIRQVNGAASTPGQAISMAGDLQLGIIVPGSADTTVEVRPLGATVALTCTVPSAAFAQPQPQQPQTEGPAAAGTAGSLAGAPAAGPSSSAAPSPGPATAVTGVGAAAAAEAPVGDTSFALSRQLLARLVEAAGGLPGASMVAALDVVRRTEQTLLPSTTEVSVEIRTSTLVELRP